MTCGSRLSVHLGQEMTTPRCPSAVTLALPNLRSIGSADSVNGIGIALLLAASKRTARVRVAIAIGEMTRVCPSRRVDERDLSTIVVYFPDSHLSRSRAQRLSYDLSCVRAPRASRELGLRAGVAARDGGLVGAHLSMGVLGWRALEQRTHRLGQVEGFRLEVAPMHGDDSIHLGLERA